MPKCLIVDDHEVVTGGLSFYLNGIRPDMTITKVGSVKAAREALREASYDLHFFDVSLPDGSGIELLSDVKSASPNARAIMYTGSASMLELDQLLELGADAIISKAEPTDYLLTAIEAAEKGERFISPAIEKQIGSSNTNVNLTPRMRSVLKLLAEGHGNKEIAARLNMAEPTVSFHLRGLRERLGVSSNRETVKKAIDLKIL